MKMLCKTLILALVAPFSIQLAFSKPIDRRDVHPRYQAVKNVHKNVFAWVDQYNEPVGVDSDSVPDVKPVTVTMAAKKKDCKSTPSPTPPVTKNNSISTKKNNHEKYRPVKEKPKPVEEEPKPVEEEPKPVEERPTKKPKVSKETPVLVASSNKPGIVYSPYNDDHSCKTAEQVAQDMEKLKGFSPIRLYGVDCKQIQNVIAAGEPYGMKVFIGIWNMDKYAPELQTLIDAVGGKWDSVHTVAIGNEVVNFGKKNAAEYANIINNCRQTLRQDGFDGPVVGVDTFVAIMSNPAICEASDYVAANCHPFFDGNVRAEDSGKFLDNMKVEIRKKCGDKKIVITEAGWPTRGTPNGQAIPSLANQKAAMKSIIETQGNSVILFTAFNDYWKSDTPLTHQTEKYWGIQDLSLRF